MSEYGNLKRVIVGEETYENTKYVDCTLKLFFKDNLSDYYQSDEFVKYDIPGKIIQERKDDLENLSNFLEKNKIEVVRPKPINKLKVVKTPDFKSVDVRRLEGIFEEHQRVSADALREMKKWLENGEEFIDLDQATDRLTYQMKRLGIE